jgi:hypothetical protein
MSEISEDQEIRMTNVLSFRTKAPAAEIQQQVARIGKFIEDGGYAKTGPGASATFAVEVSGGAQVLDMEVLIPLDKPFDPPEGCTLKPEFRLTNAVKVRHVGNPALMQASAAEINAYIQERKLTPITVGYNVTVVEPKSQAEIDQMIVDIYVGVSPNIL